MARAFSVVPKVSSHFSKVMRTSSGNKYRVLGFPVHRHGLPHAAGKGGRSGRSSRHTSRQGRVSHKHLKSLLEQIGEVLRAAIGVWQIPAEVIVSVVNQFDGPMITFGDGR